jgi:colanic acid/amylovoran biosynthesis glycosyltransferase
MKIVYITVHFPFGVREAFVLPEVAELIRQGHEILIIPLRPRGSFEGDLGELFQRRETPSILHRTAHELLKHTIKISPFSPVVLWSAALEIVSRFRASLRIAHLFATSRTPTIFLKNIAILPKALWLSRTARRWGANHIHAYWASTPASVAMAAAESAGVPWSFTAHRHDIVENNLLQQKVSRAAFVRFISKKGLAMAGMLPAELSHKLAVLHIGVQLPSTIAERQQQLPFVVLCPASLILLKGHKHLIEAIRILCARNRTVELWLAGEGPLRSRLEKQVRHLRLSDRVRFLGKVPHEDLLALYETGTVAAVVVPSLDLGEGNHEGIPVSLVEAMAFGVPVVATRTGGIPELLDCGAGLLVDSGSTTALANALEKLITDSELRSRVAVAGRKRAEEAFGIRNTVSTLIRWFADSGPEHSKPVDAKATG